VEDSKMVDQLPTLPSITERQLAAIKQQGRLRQWFAALLLGASAGLALLVNPTAAIVVAVLGVAAVWVFPSTRRRIFGDSIILRDPEGRPRFVAGMIDGVPVTALLDEHGAARAGLTLGEHGEALLNLEDADGSAQLTAASYNGITVLSLKNGFGDCQLACSSQSPTLTMKSTDASGESRTLLEPGWWLMQSAEATVRAGAIGATGTVACSVGDATAQMGASAGEGGHPVDTSALKPPTPR
jgi:hypothetical protein